MPILPIINIFGFLILGAAMIYTQWRLGSNTAARDGARVGIEVIQTYKEQVGQLRQEIESSRNLINALTIKVTRLESSGNEKDKKIAELTLFLSGKNPDQEEHMKRMDMLRDMMLEFIQRADLREDKMYHIIKNRKAFVVADEA